VVRDGLPPQKKLNTYGYMFEILDSLNTGRRKQEDAHVQELLQGEGSESQDDEKLYKVKGQRKKYK
jgi:hypothetical protein